MPYRRNARHISGWLNRGLPTAILAVALAVGLLDGRALFGTQESDGVVAVGIVPMNMSALGPAAFGDWDAHR